MNVRSGIAVFVFVGVTLSVGAPRVQAQSCQDERSMADAMVKSVADVVDTIKKESQADFEGKFHQKSCLNKLTFAIGALGEAVSCMEKAPPDPTVAPAKENESKLKDRLTQYKASLKTTDDPKAAKQLIEGFNLAAGEVTAASK